ncbi:MULTISPECIES: hypothetical protein [unclassified Ensifer]|uniref:hypothetical protein n=1 Tax=unclassified Ensifer TaxID=2633371 RepID=UPI000812D5C0|nr:MULTISPECIES: hypothetical protein [unclassified Ensifer]OCP15920.1 hypothetical protein BC363_10845 [Ensifer sp. LC384]OCP19990.1 hypothetical protein BC361_04100 [Ensifer sp. LC54]
MKHRTREQLLAVAQVERDLRPASMSRNQRLERWAELLELIPQQLLSTIFETEYRPVEVRAMLRSDNSPISVAFADAALRSAGLQSDTYGEAKRFFELSDAQLHEVICYCHFGTTVSATTAARIIRSTLIE